MADFISTPVEVRLENQTNQLVLVYDMSFYQQGELQPGNRWPEEIGPRTNKVIISDGKPSTTTGCSGFVTYRCGKEMKPVTLAFCNLGSGQNRVALGCEPGMDVWRRMTTNDFKPTTEWLEFDGLTFGFTYQCSPGDRNLVSLIITESRK